MNDQIDPIENQKNKGGLNITMLKPGTKLTIETKNSVYNIVIIKEREITLMGGMKQDGEIRYPFPSEALFIGSTWGGSLIMPNWIGEGMRLEINVLGETFSTSAIENVEIEAPDGSWYYSMDWNK